MTDEQLDLLTRTAVAGFYSDDPTTALNGPMWENLSTVQRGKWRRAARAMVRAMEGNRHWFDDGAERVHTISGVQAEHREEPSPGMANLISAALRIRQTIMALRHDAKTVTVRLDDLSEVMEFSADAISALKEPAPAISRERLVETINRKLRSYELNGGNILDAIAVYHHDDTVKEALEIVGDWSVWLADDILALKEDNQ